MASGIMVMNYEDAVFCVHQYNQSWAGIGNYDGISDAMHDLATLTIRQYHGWICATYDDGDGPQPEVDLDQLAWAATQARGGNATEACEFVSRAFANFPDALTALDTIQKRLTP